LQRNLKTFTRNGIRVFAISPDPQDVLRKFAEKYGIAYPLLSDRESRVIRAFGILNTHIPEDHDWFGIPYPGMYMVGSDGLVFDKSFFADHGVRESVNDVLQESFRVEDMERGEVQVITTPHFVARAYFASPTVRRAQLAVLTLEISLADGMHIYGRPLPEGYVPVELNVDGGDDLILRRIEYPDPEEMHLELLDERLPVYTDHLRIKAYCRGGNRDQEKTFAVNATLRYQACDDRVCYIPQAVPFSLSLRFLPHDWKRIE